MFQEHAYLNNGVIVCFAKLFEILWCDKTVEVRGAAREQRRWIQRQVSLGNVADEAVGEQALANREKDRATKGLDENDERLDRRSVLELLRLMRVGGRVSYSLCPRQPVSRGEQLGLQ